MLAACNQSERQGFALSGTIGGLQPGDTLLLATISLPVWEEEKVDTVLVEREGEFSSFVSAVESGMYLLKYRPKVGELPQSCMGGSEFFARVGDRVHLSGDLKYLGALPLEGGVYDNPAIARYDSMSVESGRELIDIFGKITVFRIDDNFVRMNNSAKRMCMPQFDANVVKPALFELLKLESEWIPTKPGTALYIRPFMFANEEVLGVHASKKYVFCIILSPVGSYYAHGLEPTKILVEDTLVRAFIGGTGEAKCSGNYACSLLGGEKANALGYDQALWLDGKEHKYVEEVGSMNIFFVIGDEVVTPQLVGSILPGITRKSCLEVLKKYGYKASERRISIDEVVKAYEDGTLKECFGTGTAAVISPVGVIGYKGKDMVVNGGNMGEITAFLYDKITGIQQEKYADEFGWVTQIN